MYKTPYMMTTPKVAELKEHIKELLEKGFIRPSSSSWGAPVIFTPRKGGTQQMCVYCRALNEVPVENKYRCLGLMVYLINTMVRVYVL
jgi:hypothetical protein